MHFYSSTGINDGSDISCWQWRAYGWTTTLSKCLLCGRTQDYISCVYRNHHRGLNHPFSLLQKTCTIFCSLSETQKYQAVKFESRFWPIRELQVKSLTSITSSRHCNHVFNSSTQTAELMTIQYNNSNYWCVHCCVAICLKFDNNVLMDFSASLIPLGVTLITDNVVCFFFLKVDGFLNTWSCSAQPLDKYTVHYPIQIHVIVIISYLHIVQLT